jgi:BASS family bile acid:Na+ symporter
MRNYSVIVTGLFTAFVLVPLLALFAKPFVSSIVYAGIMLALCCPSAVVSAFWAKAFKGDVATALVMSITTNLLSIITVPATMLLAIGASLKVNVAGMMLDLAEIILVPMTVSFLVRRFVHLDWGGADRFSSRVELCILVLLIWGSIAPGVGYVRDNVVEFVFLNAFILGILALAWALTHFLIKSFGHKRAVSIEIGTSVKNAALSLVVGLGAFGPQVLPPLIANLIAQNLLLIPAKALTEG